MSVFRVAEIYSPFCYFCFSLDRVYCQFVLHMNLRDILLVIFKDLLFDREFLRKINPDVKQRIVDAIHTRGNDLPIPVSGQYFDRMLQLDTFDWKKLASLKPSLF